MDLTTAPQQSSPFPQAGIYPQRETGVSLPKITSVTPLTRPWGAIFAVLAIFIVWVGIFILYFLNVQTASRIRSLDSSIERSKAELATDPLPRVEKQVRSLTSSLTGYKKAIAERLDLALFNNEIMKVTPKEVKLQSLTLDEKDNVRLNGTANSFITVGKALLALRASSFVSGVELQSVTYSEKEQAKEITFTLGATLNRAKLTKSGTSKTSVLKDNLGLPDQTAAEGTP